VDLPATLPSTRLGPRQQLRLDTAARMLLFAAHEAWTQSGWSATEEPLPLVRHHQRRHDAGADYRQAIATPSDRRQVTRLTHSRCNGRR
jgi:3-oxoacyl-(acyl-carrier-protein) synthase